MGKERRNTTGGKQSKCPEEEQNSSDDLKENLGLKWVLVSLWHLAPDPGLETRWKDPKQKKQKMA